MSAACQHCRTRARSRPRGLCKACFEDLRIRFLYPAQRGMRSASDTYRQGDIPEEPTQEQPGTEAKLMVMKERAARGEQLGRLGDFNFRGR